MTLIPLVSAIVAAPDAITAPTTAPALQVRGSYGAGNRHRPIAALFAVGLPAALVIAAALSPMIVEDRPTTVTPPWTSLTLPKPTPPEPRPDPQHRTQQPQKEFTEPPSPMPPVVQDPPEAPPLPPCVPTAGTSPGTSLR